MRIKDLTMKEKMLISLSCYATHKDYTFDQWLAIKKEVQNTMEESFLKKLGNIRTA